MATQVDVGRHHGSTTALLESLGRHAHWLPRAGFAGVFLFHGVEKFIGGIGGFASMMGLPLAIAALVALAEVFAGAAVLAGGGLRGPVGDWVTRLAGLACVPVMLGAIFMVHWGQWHFMATETHPMGGMEFQVVLLLLGLYFAARGNRNAHAAS